MVCKHLAALEKELMENQIKVTYRGQAWSDHCREWVYFDCVFADLEQTIDRLQLDRQRVKIHSHLGTHDGQEHGLICTVCDDGIMGLHPKTSQPECKKYI
jgi:hypothetical protein